MKFARFYAAAIVLMIGLCAQTAAAQSKYSARTIEVGGSAARTIEVTGHGAARAKPDWATINLAIETHGTTAEAAARKNAALAEKVIAALKPELGARGTIRTGGYSLFPEYENHPGREAPRITGYRAQNSITAETSALDKVGKLIDSAIAAGANRVNYLNLTLKDDTKARSEAIAAATREAHAQAAAIADALGVRLGKILQASTVSPGVHPIAMGRQFAPEAAMMAAPTTPVEGGQITVSATVYLTYGIE
ncbi:MAG: SIMPL domain-containing protein [Candidatus Binataceae bacterium]